ncbi:hypothetical protein D7223_05830 [Micromonospora endolithica]|uniref:MalT-like TPR region domain-containing protein n=2 Tax=Micromonospora endolithica TaxID=230091 RepID=A0A3A9ZV33_9ACTN|nr:hypothetical protein D7223_05830 [Micromonospora endolithica]
MYARPAPSSTLPSTTAIIAPLHKVVAFELGLDSPRFIEYLDRIIDRMNNEGAGADFRNRQEFMDLLERTIDKLRSQGRPTSNLLLALARYHGLLAGRAEARLACIESAIEDSEGRVEDRVRALLALVELYVEGSKYSQARSVLDQCERLAATTPAGRMLMPLIIAQQGIICFYDDHTRALSHFRRVAELAGGDHMPTRDCHRALALSNHFSGRICAAGGRYVEALQYLVDGQRHKESVAQEHKQLGYYHLRLGEILLNLGQVSLAKQHLEHSGALFERMQEWGSAKAQLNAALARVKAHEGDVVTAQRLLRSAIDASVRDGFQRGRLKYAVDLGRLQLVSGQVLAGVSTLLSVARIALGTDNRESLQMMLLFVRDSRRISIRRHARTGDQRGYGCPCDMHLSTGGNTSPTAQGSDYTTTEAFLS